MAEINEDMYDPDQAFTISSPSPKAVANTIEEFKKFATHIGEIVESRAIYEPSRGFCDSRKLKDRADWRFATLGGAVNQALKLSPTDLKISEELARDIWRLIRKLRDLWNVAKMLTPPLEMQLEDLLRAPPAAEDGMLVKECWFSLRDEIRALTFFEWFDHASTDVVSKAIKLAVQWEVDDRMDERMNENRLACIVPLLTVIFAGFSVITVITLSRI